METIKVGDVLVCHTELEYHGRLITTVSGEYPVNEHGDKLCIIDNDFEYSIVNNDPTSSLYWANNFSIKVERTNEQIMDEIERHLESINQLIKKIK